jgi:hypothetical protein
VQWFWCRIGPSGCQRSLATRVSDRTVAPGDPLEVTVRAYDDRGRGRAAAGVTVRLGTAHARTDARGHATLTAPARRGVRRVTAEHRGLVPAYPERVRVR